MIACKTTAITYTRIGLAHLLVEKLRHVGGLNTVIVATSAGGVVVGKHLSIYFRAPLEIVICRKLHHPSQKHKTIGSVCEWDAVTNDAEGIPQDFISHQIILHQHACRFERAQYDQPTQQNKFAGKTVVVAADEINDINSVLAVIKSIKRQNPLQIIVATGFISRVALKMLTALIDEVIYLEIFASETRHAFSKLSDNEKEITHLFETAPGKSKVNSTP